MSGRYISSRPAQLALLREGGKFDFSGAMLKEFKRKDLGEEKNWRGRLLASPPAAQANAQVSPVAFVLIHIQSCPHQAMLH